MVFTIWDMASSAKPVVGTTSKISPDELSTYHRNARIGDVNVIMGSLKVNGQFKPIVVNIGTKTGRHKEVLAGNHTLKAFRNLAEADPTDERWSKIAAHWVDVDDDQATRIVLADNRTAENSTYDDTLLYDMIKSLGGDLEGTGFTDTDASRLDYLDDLFSGPVEGDGGDTIGEDDPNVTVELGKMPKQCAEVGLTVGSIRVKVPREVYMSWYEDFREEIGFDDESMREEVLRRLGMGQ